MKIQENLKYTLLNKNVPLLVLDQKWHRLFAVDGKPKKVIKLEERLNSLLKRQAQLHQDITNLKNLKNKLMGNIVANMDGTHENPDPLSERKLTEDRRLISEINEKLEAAEDELLDLPGKMKEINQDLMLETITYSYDVLRSNSAEISELSKWIDQTRMELKKNIVKKQDCEINNREIYSYMHDIFGVQVIEMFDLDSDNILLHTELTEADA